jgi:hypothetical protein
MGTNKKDYSIGQHLLGALGVFLVIGIIWIPIAYVVDPGWLGIPEKYRIFKGLVDNLHPLVIR